MWQKQKIGAELHVYLEEGTYHRRLFRGPITDCDNDTKKQDGPSRSWPTPHTTPFFPPPEDPFPVLLRKLRPAMGTRPRPRRAAAAASGGDGARESRMVLWPTRTRCDTPATARLRRGRPLTTRHPSGHPIKRQPVTVSVEELGGRGTMSRLTTTSAAP
jgi:hypothetical protein